MAADPRATAVPWCAERPIRVRTAHPGLVGLARYQQYRLFGRHTATSLKFDEDLSSLHGIAGVDVNPGDLAGDGRRDGCFHFHRFEDQENVVNLDGLPDLGGHANDDAGAGTAANLALV